MLLEICLEISKVIFAYLYSVIGIVDLDVDIDVFIMLSNVYVDDNIVSTTFVFATWTFNLVGAFFSLSDFHNDYRSIWVCQF